ncbi:AAA family ATPase [Brevibacillus laterosporus]|uniref:AAA family ATPase n=1 Tax=Brevibacillus laterosporus TaxID=1465 RepID=UPI0026565CC2|nr:AAA family ATPase [Brevibacillus laterosporus]MDN9011715.1 AAA family ATPase [Brevibacillus laterosporus]MDO0942715.1 AAA family ATPase [Brevibacillus laterosporus]
MIIEDIHMKGFGKWQERTFTFAPGLNLFYAPNEAGKSTLLQALLASLYGMKKDFIKVSRYLDEYDRYYPWHHSSYETIVRYTLANQQFRLHRVLDKEREQIKLFLEPELTEALALYKEDRRREYNFIEKHLGLNRSLFTDITWIKREGLQAPEHLLPSLAQEGVIDPAVQGVLAALEQEYSAIGKKDNAENTRWGKANRQWQQARQALQQAEEIWQVNKHLHQSLTEWQKEEEQIQKKYDMQAKLLTEHQQFMEVWQHWWTYTYETTHSDHVARWLTEAIRALPIIYSEVPELVECHQSTQQRLARLELEIGQYPEAGGVIGQTPKEAGVREELEKAANPLEEWNKQNELHKDAELEQVNHDYQIARTIYKSLEDTRQQRYQQEVLLAQLKAALQNKKSVDAASKELTHLLQEVPQLAYYDEVVAMQTENYLRQNRVDEVDLFVSMSSRRAKTRKQKLEQSKQETRAASKIPLHVWVSGETALVTAIWSTWMIIEQRWDLVRIGSVITMIAGLLCFIFYFLYKNKLSRKRKEANIQTAQVSQIPESVSQWISRMNIDSAEQVRTLREKYVRLQHCKQELETVTQENEEQATLISKLHVEISELQQEIGQAQQTLQQLIEQEQIQSERLTVIFSVHQVDNWEEFTDKREALLVELHVLSANQGQLQAIERLEEELQVERLRAEQSAFIEQKEKDRQALLLNWAEKTRNAMLISKEKKEHEQAEGLEEAKKLEQQLAHVRERIARARGELGQQDQSSLARAKTAFEEAELALEEVQLRRDSLQLARDTLQEAMRVWHREVSPDVSQIASEVTSQITEGRYQDVRIDPTNQFSIKVIEPNLHRVIPQEKLSNGMQDQLYFAQRIAFILQISKAKEPLPIFLDDHFVHYDDQRLQSTLAYLLTLAQTHQIFLFSCQQREMLLLSEQIKNHPRHQLHNWYNKEASSNT